MKKIVVSTVGSALLVGSLTGVAAAPAGATSVAGSAAVSAAKKPCVSKAEFARIKTNGTLSPISVSGIVGVRGKIISTLKLGESTVTLIEYRGCAKKHKKRKNVVVWYQGWPWPHPAAAVAKQWVKR